MRKTNSPPRRHGFIILKKVGTREWLFEYPRVTGQVHERLGDGIDLMDSDPTLAKVEFSRLIKEYPEYLDAYHHLALTLSNEGREEEAAELWKRSVEFALELFPPSFSLKRHRVIWGFLDNRPFLRLYFSYGLSLMRCGKTAEALEVFNNLVSMNRSDNQGARALVVRCNFELQRPADALRLCNRFRNDMLEDVLYGRALALFQLGDVKRAADALKRSIRCFPRIAKHLVKASHRRPKDYDPDRVTLGGDGQAYGYWLESGKYWRETPGAIEFVKAELRRSDKAPKPLE